MTCKENDSQDKKIDRELAALMKRLHDAISRIYDDAEKDEVLAGYLEKYIKLTTTDFQRMNYDEVKNQRFLESAILAPAFASFRAIYGENAMTCIETRNTWNRILEVLQTKERSAYVQYLYSLTPQKGEPYVKENREKLAHLVRRYLEVVRVERAYAEEYAEELFSKEQLDTRISQIECSNTALDDSIYSYIISSKSNDIWDICPVGTIVFLFCIVAIIMAGVYYFWRL